MAFERAQLEFGAGLSVSLPAPGDLPDGPLPVEVAGDGPVEAPAPVSEGDVEGAVHRLTQEAQQLERTLAAATDARAKELAALRRRVVELEPSGAELAAARAQLEQMAGELANARDERDDAVRAAEEARHEADALRRALADARGGAQELLDRIGRIADPPAGGR